MKSYLDNTPGTHETHLTEYQFADDAAFLATPRAGAETALREFVSAVTDFGLKVRLQKTKVMVAGQEVTNTDTELLQMGKEEIECVEELPTLA